MLSIAGIWTIMCHILRLMAGLLLPSRYAWIGLNDIAREGSYRWMDESSATWIDWAPLNPHSRAGEDCGVVNREWQLIDTFCAGTQFNDPAVCEGYPGTTRSSSGVYFVHHEIINIVSQA